MSKSRDIHQDIYSKIMKILIMVVFVISAIILPSVLWYRRRHKFAKQASSSTLSSNITTSDEKSTA
jgi:hypothetical protein